MRRKRILVVPALSVALLGGTALGGCGSSSPEAAPAASQTGHEEAMKGEGAMKGKDRAMKDAHKSMHPDEAMHGGHHAMKDHSSSASMGEGHMGG